MSDPERRFIGFKVSLEEFTDIKTLCALEGVNYYSLIMPLLRKRLTKARNLRVVNSAAPIAVRGGQEKTAKLKTA